jgi:lupus La protein
MSTSLVESTEPDPSTTSVPNDQAAGGDQSAPDSKEEAQADVGANGKVDAKVSNGATETSADNSAEKKGDVNEGREFRGERRNQYNNRENGGKFPKKNHSKYDPSVLPETNDHKQIRAQVYKATPSN